MKTKSLYISGLLLVILLAACGKKEDTTTTITPTPAPAPAPEPAGVTAGSITLGKAVGPDKKVTAPTETFAKGDTIYASVDTSGAGTATLKAQWTYVKGAETTPVNDESQTIMPTGPATTEFHVQKPGGWPAGDYRVEVFLDGKSVGVKEFKVS
jgi:hypothetical protein